MKYPMFPLLVLSLVILSFAGNLAAQTGKKPAPTAIPAKTDTSMDKAKVDFFFDTIKNRRSVREYLPQPVPRQDLLRILDAARMAPTSGNQQPWVFLVVDDPAKIKSLIDAHVYIRGESQRKTYEAYFSAPVYIVVLTDNNSTYPSYNHYDGPLAAGYLLLAARALGYGTCFITDVIDPGVIRDELGIPEHYDIVCTTPLGVPVKWPETPPKKELDSMVAFGSVE